MVSASLAGILATICGAAGAFLGTLATVLYNYWIDARKRKREERDVVGRYRDALLHASEELQTPLRHLCDGIIPSDPNSAALDYENAEASYDYCHLIYLIGRLFCWTYIIENDIRNVHYLPTEDDNTIMNILYSIKRTLADAPEGQPGEATFHIFKGFQAAIGEKMAVTSEGQIGCMGYAAFWNQWTLSAAQTSASNEELPFRAWFRQIEEGLAVLKKDPLLSLGGQIPVVYHLTSRIQKFQHLLVALSETLDPQNRRIHYHERLRWGPDERKKPTYTWFRPPKADEKSHDSHAGDDFCL